MRASGRKLLLVTGRQLDDLRSVFVEIDLFDAVVAENGALLYDPRTQRERTIAEPPPDAFVEALRRRYIPVSVGHVIVATWEPHEREVLETIRDLGLELQVIFNKGAVMVLPAGVSKASGLAAALAELGLSPHNVVGVGDAENDHAFLAVCECAVAVANALPTIKERADVVTKGEAGAGVEELAAELVATDLQSWEPALERHWVLLGRRPLEGGGEVDVRIPPYGSVVLVAGSSRRGQVDARHRPARADPRAGRTSAASSTPRATTRRSSERCRSALRSARRPTKRWPRLLEDPTHQRRRRPDSASASTDRPNAVAKHAGATATTCDARWAARTGWLIDEAHHAAPSSIEPAPALLAAERAGGSDARSPSSRGRWRRRCWPPRTSSSPSAMHAIEAMAEFAGVIGSARRTAAAAAAEQPPGRPWALVVESPLRCSRRSSCASCRRTAERERHVRKYAEGELAPDRSFYFRGPDGTLNLRAQNLIVFNQMADGIDDGTWLHHLRRRRLLGLAPRADQGSRGVGGRDRAAIERTRRGLPPNAIAASWCGRRSRDATRRRCSPAT